MSKGTRKKSMIARFTAIFFALVMTLQTGMVTVLAAPTVKKTEYDKKGIVEVDFRGRVQYKNVKVTVKDNKGVSYKASIREKDSDELEFVIRNYKAGRTYTYKISGIKARGESNYGSVSGKVKIPAATKSIKVKKIKYDAEDRELDIDFSGKVFYKKPVIKITNGSTTYKATITDRDNDEMEVYVRGLRRGTTYKYTITGVGKSGTNKTVKLSGTFRA